MVANKNKYIDYEGVYEYLAARDYTEKFDPRDFMLEGLILRDIHTNGGLQNFFSQYRDAKLDVVSLAEIQSMIDYTHDDTSKENQDLITQIETVLEHVEEQLEYVSNDRRQQITLGEFMTRHHYLNNKSYRHYSTDLLKSQIENALGSGQSQ